MAAAEGAGRAATVAALLAQLKAAATDEEAEGVLAAAMAKVADEAESEAVAAAASMSEAAAASMTEAAAASKAAAAKQRVQQKAEKIVYISLHTLACYGNADMFRPVTGGAGVAEEAAEVDESDTDDGSGEYLGYSLKTGVAVDDLLPAHTALTADQTAAVWRALSAGGMLELAT